MTRLVTEAGPTYIAYRDSCTNIPLAADKGSGVVKACRELKVDVPLVVRLAGTNVEAGRDIIAKSGLPIISADTLADAAKAAVGAARGAPQRDVRTA